MSVMFHERVDDGGDKLKYVSAKTTIQEPTGHLYIVQREMDVLSQEVFHILVLGRGGNKSRRRWGRTSTIQQILDKTCIKTFTLTILDLEGQFTVAARLLRWKMVTYKMILKYLNIDILLPSL